MFLAETGTRSIRILAVIWIIGIPKTQFLKDTAVMEISLPPMAAGL